MDLDSWLEIADAIPPLPGEISFDSYSGAGLVGTHRKLSPPVIDSIARRGDVMSLIAGSKEKKTFVSHDLLLSVASGTRWLDTFPTIQGPVLLIDNELHLSLIASRLRSVCDAKGLPRSVLDWLEIWPLKNTGLRLPDLAGRIERRAARLEYDIGMSFALIMVDSKYLFTAQSHCENTPSHEAKFFQTLGRIAQKVDSLFGITHHSTKGPQDSKKVTDRGSGSGAQSRIVDAHLTLSEGNQPGTAVFEGVTRSFPPIEPLGLRWDFPLFHPDPTVTQKRRKPRGGARPDVKDVTQNAAQDGDADIDEAILAYATVWRTARSFREMKLPNGEKVGPRRIAKALERLLAADRLEKRSTNKNGNECLEYRSKGIPTGGEGGEERGGGTGAAL
jgi:hypothetical protein